MSCLRTCALFAAKAKPDIGMPNVGHFYEFCIFASSLSLTHFSAWLEASIVSPLPSIISQVLNARDRSPAGGISRLFIQCRECPTPGRAQELWIVARPGPSCSTTVLIRRHPSSRPSHLFGLFAVRLVSTIESAPKPAPTPKALTWQPGLGPERFCESPSQRYLR